MCRFAGLQLSEIAYDGPDGLGGGARGGSEGTVGRTGGKAAAEAAPDGPRDEPKHRPRHDDDHTRPAWQTTRSPWGGGVVC